MWSACSFSLVQNPKWVACGDVVNYRTRALTVHLTSIDHPQIEGKFTMTPGGITKLFYGCIDQSNDWTSQCNHKIRPGTTGSWPWICPQLGGWINLEEHRRLPSPTRMSLEEPGRLPSPTRINLKKPGRLPSSTRVNSFLCLSVHLWVSKG